MIWKKTKTSGMLLCLALCAACSSDNDEPVVVQPPVTSYPLTIEVSENPLIPDGQEARGETRASITTTTTLTAFNLNYVYVYNETRTGSENVRKEGGIWKVTNEGGWPSDAASSNVEVTWYASTSGTFNLNEGDPYIDFTVEADAADQEDLLVAKTSGKYSDYYTNGVNVKSLSFTFDHACTALKFYVKKAKNLYDYTLKVSNIKLKNVVNRGTYNYGSGEWKLFNTNSDFTLLNTETTLSSDSYTLLNGNEENSYLFMIPQTLTAWKPEQALSDCYLEIVCEITKDGNPEYSGTAYIPFSATFAKGYQHDVKINIGKNSLYSAQNTNIIN